MNLRKLIWAGSALVAAYQLWLSLKHARLVQQRKLHSTTDEAGNYDIDGVSYDPEEGQVVVGSDGFTEGKPKQGHQLQ